MSYGKIDFLLSMETTQVEPTLAPVPSPSRARPRGDQTKPHKC